jgi:ABC-2 type transport system permease protein
MWAIARKEWAHYFGSITGYFIISFYLLVNSLFLFVLPKFNILDGGYASLQVYFDFAPWFLLLLVPAITMRCFADEVAQGTAEILYSLPLSTLQIVMGKLLGVFCIILIAIAPTLIYAVALDQLSSTGGLDWGATIGSYLGLLLLATTYAVIGLFASSKTKQPVVAFILSIIIAALLYKGFDWASTLPMVNSSYGYYIGQLGMSTHFENLSRGVISGIDVIYFLSVIVLFVIGCKENITQQKQSIFLFAIIIVINILSAYFPLQLDLTKDKRYTLSTTSKDILHSVQNPIKIHLYLGGDLPMEYKKLSIATEEILQKITSENKDNISWQLDIPSQQFSDSILYQVYDSLSRLGLPIERVQSDASKGDQRIDQLIIPGVLIEMPGRPAIAIDLRTGKKFYKPYNIVKDIPEEDKEASFNAASSLLEFKMVQGIYYINRTNIPTIGYLIGNGEPIDLSVNDLGQSIRHQYNLVVFDLKKGFPKANLIKTLLIVKPTQAFTELDQLKIDQYIMNGGNIIWAVDPLFAEYDSLQKTSGSYVAYDRNLQVQNLLFSYGVRLNKQLVQDLNCSKIPVVTGKDADGNPVIQRIPWPYYPLLNGNASHKMVKNMDRILSQFPSSIDTLAVPGIQKTILLSTDTNSRILSTPAMISLTSVNGDEALQSFTKSQIPVAVLLEGKFKSPFANRINAATKDSVLLNTGKAYLQKGNQFSKQVVIADADILTNSISSSGPLPMGMIPMENYQFGNRTFFTNAIAYLNEPEELMTARDKEWVVRTLNKEKVSANRLFWQILLTAVPLILLWLAYYTGLRIRKGQFAV